MSTVLLILSTLLFHMPFAFFKDTARRLDQMNKYKPSNARKYKHKEYGDYGLNSDSNPILKKPIFIITGVSSLILALFPLFEILDFNWFIIIALNIILAFFVTPFIAFAIIPSMSIYTRRILNLIVYTCVLLGFILFFVGKAV